MPADLRAPARWLSLDAFRGLTMAAMVIVNNPGDWGAMYWPLEHAEWNGWTPTDLIFPFFLFIVGVSLTLSRQTTTGPWWKVGRRALLLVAFGLLLTGFPRFDPTRWRFTGILPRIGFCYLLAAVHFRLTASLAGSEDDDGAVPRWWNAQVTVIAATTVTILIWYWFVLMKVAPPGGQAGDLTPEGNIGAYYDRLIFGSHLLRRARWDPEGLLSSVPSVATTLIGVLAGLWVRRPGSPGGKVIPLAAAGTVLFVMGELWHPWFPINKQLWTSSYVLLTGGAACIVLATCMHVIDVRGWRRWSQPFVVLGSNAILLFVVSGLIGKAFVVWHLNGPDGRPMLVGPWLYTYGIKWMAAPKNASLVYSLVFLAVMYLMCDVCYRRRLFLKL